MLLFYVDEHIFLIPWKARSCLAEHSRSRAAVPPPRGPPPTLQWASQGLVNMCPHVCVPTSPTCRVLPTPPPITHTHPAALLTRGARTWGEAHTDLELAWGSRHLRGALKGQDAGPRVQDPGRQIPAQGFLTLMTRHGPGGQSRFCPFLPGARAGLPLGWHRC